LKDLEVYDPLNNQGQIAFWATNTSGGKAILRAVPKANHPYAPDRFGKGKGSAPDSPLVEYVHAATANVARAQPRDINQIVLHATGTPEREALNEFTSSGKSIHYLVSREGRVTQMVPESLAAIHALNNNSDDPRATDKHSIGIEMVDERFHNDPHNNKTDPTWATGVELDKAALLVRDIGHRYGIPLKHLVPGIDAFSKPSHDEGFRNPNYDFAVPNVVPQAFETVGNYMEATDLVYPQNGNPQFAKYPDGFDYTAWGILSHGQVLNRSHGRSDPLLFNWPGFMTRVNQGAVFTLHSPANLYVTDAQGRHTGVDPVTGQVVLEIPGSEYSGPGTEPQTISIPDATEGDYSVQLVGTGTGNYHLDILGADQGGELRSTVLGDTISTGESDSYTFHYSAANDADTGIQGVPRISIADVTAPEGNAGTTAFDFTVSLDSAPGQPVTLD
jgi:hypothetical protein